MTWAKFLTLVLVGILLIVVMAIYNLTFSHKLFLSF